jgi:hypothetical protein
MDYDDGENDDEVVIDAGPAYNPSAWRTHENSGPQCSQSREFCYLCTHTPHPPGEEFLDEDGEPIPDFYTMIVNVIQTLVAERESDGTREIAVIVNAIYNMYEDEVRQDVKYDHPITGALLDRPEWSKASIERHILYSGICPELHDTLVDHIFNSVIDAQNKVLMNKGTGRVVEEERKNFMDTMKHYTSWRKFRFAAKASLRQTRKKVAS